MARQHRPSGHPPEGADPRDHRREYDDDAELADDADWLEDDDLDPDDDRPLPRRRRRRRRRLASALAWVGGLTLVIVLGGLLALVAWRGPGPAAVSGTSEVSPAPVVPAPPTATDTPVLGAAPPSETASDTSGHSSVATQAGRSTSAPVRGGEVLPPPLPPLPPGFEAGTPSAATRPGAAPRPDEAPPLGGRAPGEGGGAQPDEAGAQSGAEVAARGVTEAPGSPPATPPPVARAVTPFSPPALSRDTRTSEEIMADFLMRSGDRAGAEATSRAYAEWYPAGSAERAYWQRVLDAVRARP